jgi:hypothetical protein
MGRRAAFRSWVLWIADPEPRFDPSLPLPAVLIRELLDHSARHGVLPAAMRNLSRVVHLGSSSANRDELAWENTAKRDLAAAEERLCQMIGLSELLRATGREIEAIFHARGIEMLVVKGPTFADRLYPDPALRPFTDIDLLVPDRAIGDSRKALADAGLSPAGEPAKKYAGRYAEEKWQHPRLGRSPVELHWNLVNSPKVRRVISLSYDDIAGHCVDGQFSPTALLIIAAVHGAAGHGFERLQTLIDVAQAARGAAGPIDINEALSLAERTGARLCLETALLTCALVLRDVTCMAMVQSIGPSNAAKTLGRLLGARVIVESQGPYHHRHSWRRQLYREALVRLSQPAKLSIRGRSGQAQARE